MGDHVPLLLESLDTSVTALGMGEVRSSGRMNSTPDAVDGGELDGSSLLIGMGMVGAAGDDDPILRASSVVPDPKSLPRSS